MPPGPALPNHARPELPVAGDVIAGKYAIVRVLGEGGMGVVFEATHVRLRQRVAVKMLLPEMLGHDVIVVRFEREARAAAQLRSRHVARVMDVDTMANGMPYMVMEFLEGRDLDTELEHRGKIPYEEVVDWVLQSCAAMIEAHQLGIVHRDLKPSNLFLALDNDVQVVKVLDFGISKVLGEGDTKLTAAESVMGTAMYMSPEQVRSAGNVDARSDIWSLGVILYELIAGRAPWIGSTTQVAAAIVTEDPKDLRAFALVPPALAAIVTKTLQRRPEDRFTDVRQLVVALAPFAPAGSAGRLFADSIAMVTGPRSAMSSSHGLPNSSPSAPTMIQPSSDAGTAPGWTQPGAPSSRNRAALVGLFIALAVGAVAFMGAVLVYMRLHAKVTAVAAPTSFPAPSAAVSIDAQPTAPSTASESPPAVATASTSVVPTPQSTRARPATSARGPTNPPHVDVKPSPATPTPSPENPLHL